MAPRLLPLLAALVMLPAVAVASPPAGPAPAVPDGGWTAVHAQGHPLVGRLWDTAAGRFLSEDELADRLAGARFVLLGEKHDNPDHHRLQARLLEAMIARGRRPAVAFEMFDASQADALAAHLRDRPGDAAGLGAAVEWEKTGWPEWSTYQPIAAAALAAGLPVTTANFSRDTVRGLAREGLDSLPAELRAALALPEALPPKVDGVIRTSVVDGHCGMMPEAMADPMVRVQAARDALMARALIDGAALPGADGAVLIAGNGHIRTDAAAPWHLERLGAAERGVLTVAMMEVTEEETDPAAYGPRYWADGLPFDVVWFTPVVDLGDPCEAMRAHMKGAARHSAEPPPAKAP
ncbi:ChaN family lipoprotein [Novispirillum sp. DQ9]|uniref:ChaN family lipoprotein n=1 Tax=Novispirillum sp. DQ9 TaxID=3398612 RepID=UPI003C7BFDF2